MASTDRRLRVGVVGVGSLGQWHAKVYAELEAAELAGVYDIDARRAAEIAARYGTVACASLEDLAAKIEAASVAVPPDQHAAVACVLMERGIHVLVEKPIADSLTAAERMLAVAQQRRTILQVGHVERFNPVLRCLEETLTQPRFIEAVRLAPYPPPREGRPPRGTEVSVVLDLMIHDLEIVLHLVRAPVAEIRAVGVPVLSTGEDIANVRLAFANGAVANVTASRVSAERLRKIRVFQPDTYLSLDYEKQCGYLVRKVGSTIVRSEVPVNKAEPLKIELASFVQCVLEHREPVVNGVQAADALRLAVEICRQIREETR